ELYNAALPCARRGAQAALSPNLGAPATPVLWQAVQVPSKVALPSALPAVAPAGAAPEAAATCAGAAAAGAGAGIFAFVSFSHAAYCSGARASTTIGMYACSLPQ